MKKVLAGIAVLALIAGCAATGVKVSDEQLAKLKKGETTRSEVLATLGKPTMQMKLADGTSLLTYSYFEYSTRPATFIPIVGAFAGGADSRSNSVSLRFDANDKLIDNTSMSSEYGTGMGAAAGAIAPVEQQPRK